MERARTSGVDPQNSPTGLKRLSRRFDLWPGSVLLVLGLLTVLEGVRYETGTLTRMGPGFFPICLGVLLAIIGLAVMLKTPDAGEAPEPTRVVNAGGRVLLAIGTFAALLNFAGLIPAAFGLILISGSAHAGNRVVPLIVLSAFMSVFVSVVFVHVLGIPFVLIAGW